MVRVWLLAGLLILAGAAARAGDQPVYAAQPPAWVKPIEIPPSQPGHADGAPAIVLLDQAQSQLSTAGDTFFMERAVKVLTPEGLGQAGTVSETWDPDTEDLTIHWLRVIRGGQVIDALAGGRKLLVLPRENKLELAMLDGRLTATLQPEGLQVGDIIDFAYTKTRHDPALGGNSEDMDRLDHTGVAERVYWRSLWSPQIPIRWRTTDGVVAPTVRPAGDWTELVVDMRAVTAPKPPAGAPPRYYDLGSVEFSRYADWAQLSKQLSPVWQKATTLAPGSPLQAEVARIAAASRDPKARAMAALRLVEDSTRYVFLGMNDGGLVPAEADSTWSRRFGDCKGKTALLVALLRALGVEAQPVLVNTTFGDGMDQRLPMAAWFDHAIVRAEIGGRVYWLDGTRTGDRSLDDLTVPAYYWALPIRPEGGGLIRMQPLPLEQPAAEEVMTIDASRGANTPAPTHLVVIYRGEEAAHQRATIASQPKADFERGLREFWTKTYPWLTLDTVTSQDDPDHGAVTLVADGAAHLEWSTTSGGGLVHRVPFSAVGDDASFKREPGPHQDAPYQVSFPSFTRSTRRYTLPTDGDFTLVGADVDVTVAGVQMKRRARIEGGVLTVETSERALVPEFPAAEAEAAGVQLRELARRDVAIGYRVRTAGAPAPAAASERAETPKATGRSPKASMTLSELTSRAEAGNPAAQYELAEHYTNGDGVPFDEERAVALYRKAAQSGYASAQEALGAAYARGSLGLTRDYAQALDWLGRAAAQGNSPARGELAGMYLFGWGTAKDPARAAALAQQAAVAGDRFGQFFLGLMYAEGVGVRKDAQTAFDYLSKAAAQGLAPAQSAIARAYFDGEVVARDRVKAALWARKAADQGDSDGALIMGLVSEAGEGAARDLPEALRWYRKAAEGGDADAQFAVGRLLYNGQGGVARDRAEAFDWLRKAADQHNIDAEFVVGRALVTGEGLPLDLAKGMAYLSHAGTHGNPEAAVTLGAIYVGGDGVPRDYALAMALFTAAAKANAPSAMVALGAMNEEGLGVAMDLAQAIGWYRRAAEAGNPAGESALGRMYLFGRGIDADPAQALTWLRKAGEGGNRRALYLLGRMYQQGRGLPKDDRQAFDHFSQAAERGDLKAAVALARCYRDGVGASPDTAKAVEWFTRAARGGEVDAEYELGMMYLRGQGVTADRAQALAWLQRAADGGSAEAQKSLAGLPGARPRPPPPLPIAPVAAPPPPAH